MFRAGIRFATLETLPIDALEVFNAATTLRRYNTFAFRYAQLRGLPMTAASDAHHAAAVGTCLYHPQLRRAVGEIRSRVRFSKATSFNQRYLTPRDSMKKTWNNWLRLRRKTSRYHFARRR